MKKFLTGFVVLVVLLIAALVIVPSFINWNNHKAEIIAAVRDATGRTLSIEGDISLKIIPAPALSVQDVSLAGLPGAGGAPMLTLKALEVRVALAPLMSGDIQVTSVRLIEPSLVLEVLSDGRVNWQFEAPGNTAAGNTAAGNTDSGSEGAGSEGEGLGASGAALSLDKLAVENATLIYRDNRTGLEERVVNISLNGSATTLRGPFRFTGKATARGLPLGFDLSLDEIAEGRPIGIRLHLNTKAGAGDASFTGRLEHLEDAPRLNGQLALSADNVAALQDALLPGTGAPEQLQQPLTLKASIEATAKTVTLNDIDLAFGPLQGVGAVTVSLGEQPSYGVALAISRLDLDRLMQGTAAAQETQDGTRGGDRAAAMPVPAIPANLRGSILVTVEGLRYRRGVVSQVQLNASIEDGTLRLERLSALLPGGSDLRLSGEARDRNGVPQFSGSIELASNNLRGLLNWLDANPASIPAGRLANMVLTSDFTINPSQAQISNMNLRLDSTTIEGAATILLQSRPSFGLALNVDRINLDGYLPKTGGPESPSPGSSSSASNSGADIGTDSGKDVASPWVVLEQFDSNLILNVGELAYNAAPITGLSVELGLAAGKLTLRKATVRNLADASFSLSGSGEGFSGAPRGKAKVRLRAKYVDGLARLAGVELPVPPKRLKGLTVDGELSGGPGGLAFDIRSTLSGLKTTFNGRVSGPPDQQKADLNFELSHGSLAALSRTFDFGIHPLPRNDKPVALRGTLRGGMGMLNLDLKANVAGAELGAKGTLRDLEQAAQINLTIGASHKDLKGLLAALGNKFPADRKSPGAVQIGTTIRGGGNRFALSNLKGTVGALDLGGEAVIELSGPRPKLTANLQGGEVILDHFLGAGAAASRPTGGKQPGAAAKNQRNQRRGNGRWSRDTINLAALQSLDADIKLAAKRLVFQRYPFEEPHLHLTLTNGVLRVEELTGRLFKGNVGLRATLNSQPPGLGLSIQLRGADINEAMRTALDMDQVSGLLDFTGQFQTRGASQWDLVNALSGTANVHAVDGVIRGFDLKIFSDRLGSLNEISDFLNLAQRAFSGGETKYQSVDGNWTIKNGVAETQDMVAQLDAAQATVKGKVRLPPWNMDLRAVLRLTEHRDAPDMGLHLYGPLDQPQRDLKTAALERWLLTRLGRELLGQSSKTKDLGKFLEAITGGGRAPAPQPSTQSGTQPSTPSGTSSVQPSQSGGQQQPKPKTDPTQQLLEGLFKALKKN